MTRHGLFQRKELMRTPVRTHWGILNLVLVLGDSLTKQLQDCSCSLLFPYSFSRSVLRTIKTACQSQDTDTIQLIALLFLLTGSAWSQNPGWIRSLKQLTHTDVEDSHPDNRDLMRRLIEEGPDNNHVQYTDEDTEDVVRDAVNDNADQSEETGQNTLARLGAAGEQGSRVLPSSLADTDHWREETQRAAGPG